MPGPAPYGPAVVPSLLKVTLRSLGVDYQQIVQVFSPSQETYGFVFSIDELLTRINTAFAAAFAAMVPVAGVTSPPILAFNPQTQLISMYYQETYATAPVEIYVNTPLYNLIRSIPAALLGQNLASGKDFIIQTAASSVVRIPTIAAGRPGYPVTVQAVTDPVDAITQAGISLQAMNGVRTIYISTNLPIAREETPSTTGVAQNANSSSNSESILTDFLMSTDADENPVVDRINISYLPTAEYRMIQMQGMVRIKEIKLDWFYTLFDGSTRRMTIPPGGVCSVKLMFRRAPARDTLA